MENQPKELFGSWTQAIGTLIAAIGSTPSNHLNKDALKSLDLWGNALQATGNALIADAQETNSLNKLGNEVQAIGNTTVIAGMVLAFNDETKQKLIINGNWLQALGGGVSLSEDVEQEPSDVLALNIIGNILQVIGNSLQAIGGIYKLKSSLGKDNEYSSKEGQSLEINGSWIQAIGAVISAISQTKEAMSDKKESTNGELFKLCTHQTTSNTEKKL
jgi:hypothetical protein